MAVVKRWRSIAAAAGLVLVAAVAYVVLGRRIGGAFVEDEEVDE